MVAVKKVTCPPEMVTIRLGWLLKAGYRHFRVDYKQGYVEIKAWGKSDVQISEEVAPE